MKRHLRRKIVFDTMKIKREIIFTDSEYEVSFIRPVYASKNSLKLG